MGRFTKISADTFNELQLDAGVLLNNFDPENPAAPADEDIICATTGGINATCVPTYSDFGEDIDNVPANMMELKHLDSWECTLSTTALGATVETIKLSIGAADVSGTRIIPRRDLKLGDFKDEIWWVGDRADGGLVAVKLMHVLSSGGFNLQTTKNGKGQLTLELLGHVSMAAQSVVPMEFYAVEGESYTITQTLSHVTSSNSATSVQNGDSFYAVLTAASGYTMTGATVSVTMGGTNITSTAYNNGVVSISEVTGNVVITATAVSE